MSNAGFSTEKRSSRRGRKREIRSRGNVRRIAMLGTARATRTALVASFRRREKLLTTDAIVLQIPHISTQSQKITHNSR
jgi:hypothetical protein